MGFIKSLVSFLALALLSASAKEVDVDPSLIPQFDHALPVLELGGPSFLKLDVLNDVVAKTFSGASFKDQGEGTLAAYDSEDMRIGFVNKLSGKTRISAEYTALSPITSPIDAKKALEAFIDVDAFPVDDTEISGIVIGSRLRGMERTRRGLENITEHEYAVRAMVERSVKDIDFGTSYPVCGPGSQASFSIARNNQVIGVDYRWKAAKRNGQAIKPERPATTIQTIKKILLPRTSDSTGIKVTNIDVCFYDSGNSFIQPVYRVVAEAYTVKEAIDANTGRILLYVPLGRGSPEPLPQLASQSPQDPSPSERSPISQRNRTALVEQFGPIPQMTPLQQTRRGEIFVGRYVVQRDPQVSEFVRKANHFWEELEGSIHYIFNDAQYYWADSLIYGAEAEFYVDNVRLALTEGYGRAHYFTTYSSWGDVVTIPRTIPSSGYGAAGGLGWWIIDAGETVPAPIDFIFNPISAAFNAWDSVFKGGINAVLGWRTLGFLQDEVAEEAAVGMHDGWTPVSAWLDAASRESLYSKHPGPYTNPMGFPRRYGKACALYICGRGRYKLNQPFQTGPYRGCLEMLYWD